MKRTPEEDVPQQPNGHAALASTPQTELDINKFRLDQNFNLHVQARKKAVIVPVQRPDRQAWVYLHPDPGWHVPITVLEDKVNRRTYVVDPAIAPDVTEDLAHKLLVAYITRTGNPAFWAIRLPGEDGRIDSFNESALAIVASHSGQWIRVLCDQADRSYSVLESPPVELPVPKWPDGGFSWMFQTAFKSRVIASIDHPLLQTLRGGR